MPLSFLFITSSLLLDHNLFGISRSYEENNNKKTKKTLVVENQSFSVFYFLQKNKKNLI